MNGPEVICPRVELGELAASAQAGPWCSIAPISLCEATTGAAPKQATRVRCAWSEDEWRILFECDDADPWATLVERDAPLYEEETVEVFFDPIGDLESYYEIEVNPLGAILDLVFRRIRSGYRGDAAWDCAGVRAKVVVAEGGWTAELGIPFQSVAARPRPGDRWRVNFCRIDRPSRDNSLPRELSAWSAPLRANFHTPERFGTVRFEICST